MIHQPSKLFIAVLAAALCALPAAAQTNKAASSAKSEDKMTQLFGDPAIAKGKGFEVKRSQLDQAITGIRSSLAARGQPISAADMDVLERRVLKQLIHIEILMLKATDQDKAKGKEAADKRLAEMLRRAGSQERFNAQLKSVGLSPEQMRARMVEESVAEAVVEREMKVTITDADVKKFYDDHPSRFEQPETVRVAQILMTTLDPTTGKPYTDAQNQVKRKQLEAVLKRARAGEDFAKLAREISEDTEAKQSGGELPPFPRDSMPRTPEFESAAFSLNTNQVSDIVTTPFGYHIIKLLEKIPAKKVELATVAERLKEGLKQDEMIKRLPDYSEKLEAESKVEILDEKLSRPLPKAIPGEDPTR